MWAISGLNPANGSQKKAIKKKDKGIKKISELGIVSCNVYEARQIKDIDDEYFIPASSPAY